MHVTYDEFLYREHPTAITRQRFRTNGLPSFGFYREGGPPSHARVRTPKRNLPKRKLKLMMALRAFLFHEPNKRM